MEITLALGGGGVKGNAHIGVLRVLESEKLRIRGIAGTSIGGLVGALYAAGYSSHDIEAMMLSLDQASMFSREAGEGPAMMGLHGIRQLLLEKLGGLTFADLRIPLVVTATDLDNACTVAINSGSVYDAVMATIAVPGVFPPVFDHGKTLVDGGVLDPVPVALARSFATERPVVAVVLSPLLTDWEGPANPRLLHSMPFLATYVARLRIAQALNIFLRSVDIAGAMMTELRLQIDHPEVIIRPDVGMIGLLDRIDVAQVVNLGVVAARESLPAIYQSLGWQGWLARNLPWTMARADSARK